MINIKCACLDFNKYTLGVTLLIFISFQNFAQFLSSPYEYYAQHPENRFLINPAPSDTNNASEVMFNNLSDFGYNVVGGAYLDARARLTTPRSSAQQSLGIQFINYELGNVLRETGLSLRYTWMKRITSKSFLSAGVMGGFRNFQVNYNSTVNGGSYFVPLGTVGLHYVRNQFQIGGSLNRFFGRDYLVVFAGDLIEEYYNLDVLKSFRVSENLLLSFQFLANIQDTGETMYSGAAFINFYQQFVVGYGIKEPEKSSIYIGMNDIAYLNSLYTVYLTYNRHSLYYSLLSDTIEITIGIKGR